MKRIPLIIIISLLAIVIVATGYFVQWRQSQAAPIAPVVFDPSYRILAAKNTPRARIFIYGSLNILSGPDFESILSQRGFEVVFLAIPQIDPKLYRGDGVEYRATFTLALQTSIAGVEKERGRLPSLIGGGSIGGLHAMMGYALVPGFVGWFASMPVTKLTALSEFEGKPEPAAFNPFGQVDRLKGSTGFMTWGTADTRVDYRLSKELHSLIEPTVASVEYAGLEHATTPRQIDDLVAWIDKQF